MIQRKLLRKRVKVQIPKMSKYYVVAGCNFCVASDEI